MKLDIRCRLGGAKRALLSVVMLLGGICWAFGGYYTVSYSGSGQTTVDWISGGLSYTGAYSPPYMGSGSVAPTGSVYCRGPITATLKFVPNPSIPNDQPPPFIVVGESSSAMWTGDSGNCSDGLGDPEVDSSNGSYTAGPNQGVSSGTHYFVISNPGASTTITQSPSAFGYGNINGPDVARLKGGQGSGPGSDNPNGVGPIGTAPPPIPTGRVNASVSFSVSTFTPILSLSDVTWADNCWNIQIGVGTNASVYWVTQNNTVLSTLPSPLSCVNFNWDVPGETFATWNTSLANATLVPVTWGDSANQSWTWSDASGLCDEGGEEVSPSVSFTVDDNGSSIGSGTLTQNVTVWRPYSEFVPEGTVGDPAYNTFPNPSYVAAGIPEDGSGAGCAMYCNVGVSDVFGPSPGTKSLGAGSINWCQLVDMDDIAWWQIISWQDNTSNNYLVDVNSASTNWYWLIDGSGGPQNQACVIDENWPTGMSYGQFYDTPGWTLTYRGLLADQWSVNYQFENWVMYIPDGGQWVPLLYSEWSWVDGATSPFANPPGGPPELGRQGIPTDNFPEWAGYHNGG